MVKSLLDKVLFTLGVLLFLQLPNFVDHYVQRLGGYQAAQQTHLMKYQGIADDLYKGNVNLLIANFLASPAPAVHQTGQAIAQIKYKVDELHEALAVLNNSSFINKVRYIISHPEPEIVSGTIRSMQPAIGFRIESVVCGLFGGLLFSVLFHGIIGVFSWLFRSRQKVSHQLLFKPATSI